MGNSKLFVFLTAAQFVLFGILLFRLSAVEQGITGLLADASVLDRQHGSMATSAATQPESHLFSDTRLRTIVRDEIEAVLARLPVARP